MKDCPPEEVAVDTLDALEHTLAPVVELAVLLAFAIARCGLEQDAREHRRQCQRGKEGGDHTGHRQDG